MTDQSGKTQPNYEVFGSKDGQEARFTGTSDTRWAAVVLAHQMEIHGYENVGILFQGKLDDKGMSDLRTRYTAKAAKEVDMVTADTVARLNITTSALAKQARKGGVNALDVAQLLHQSIGALKALGVDSNSLVASISEFYPELASRRSRQEAAAQ